MIPDHLIDQAAAAIYATSAFGDEFAYDAWHDMPDDSPVKTATRMLARAALETAAADFWTEGHIAGFIDGIADEPSVAPNPYRASETA